MLCGISGLLVNLLCVEIKNKKNIKSVPLPILAFSMSSKCFFDIALGSDDELALLQRRFAATQQIFDKLQKYGALQASSLDVGFVFLSYIVAVVWPNQLAVGRKRTRTGGWKFRVRARVRRFGRTTVCRAHKRNRTHCVWVVRRHESEGLRKFQSVRLCLRAHTLTSKQLVCWREKDEEWHRVYVQKQLDSPRGERVLHSRRRFYARRRLG